MFLLSLALLASCDPQDDFEEPISREASDFQIAREADSPRGWRIYLQLHPGHQDAEFARERLTELGAQDWSKLGATPDAAALREHLTTFPDGPTRANALARLEEIRSATRVRALEEIPGLRGADDKSRPSIWIAPEPDTGWAVVWKVEPKGELDPGDKIPRIKVVPNEELEACIVDDAPYYEVPMTRSFFGSEVNISRMFVSGAEWTFCEGASTFLRYGVAFKSDEAYPLLFRIEKTLGLAYIAGRGDLSLIEGDTLSLGDDHSSSLGSALARSADPALRQAGAWMLGWLATSPEDRREAVMTLCELTADPERTVSLTAAEVLRNFSEPDLIKMVVDAWRGRTDTVTRLFLDASLLHACSVRTLVDWPPADDRAWAETGHRIHVPSLLTSTNFAVGSITMKGPSTTEDLEQGVIMMSTERPQDRLAFAVSGMAPEGVAVGIGSEVRFAGRVNALPSTIVVEGGDRLCFRRTPEGWVYLCGRGTFEFEEGKRPLRLGFDRSVPSCLLLAESPDPILREGAIRDLGRLAAQSDTGPTRAVIDVLCRTILDPVAEVRYASVEALGVVATEAAHEQLQALAAEEHDDETFDAFVEAALRHYPQAGETVPEPGEDEGSD